jgi:MoaA/NifB/PqqE/SkfB family radical SAM enzyme
VDADTGVRARRGAQQLRPAIMTSPVVHKLGRALARKADSLYGRVFSDLPAIVETMAQRPFELHLELTNLCNANCVFCPYQFQTRATEVMSDEVFRKAVADFVAINGGSVGLTPIVGDALIDPKFLERVRYLRSLQQIDRIFLTTNAILLDRFGIRDVLTSGVTSINISTASFDKDNYTKIYRNLSYERMRKNVTALVEENATLGRPVNVSIGLRTDRPLADVMRDPDFQPILAHDPEIDFTWSFTSAGGRITRELLPPAMKLRTAPPKAEACVNLFNGPMVLPTGDVLGCSCVAAMDALPDLLIGNIHDSSLLDIWTGHVMRDLRRQFAPGACGMNPTCGSCEMYRDLEMYRTREGRARAELNRQRLAGRVVRRADKAKGIFSGG